MCAKTITIVANGSNKAVIVPCTVDDFLSTCGWRSTQVVVELNGNVLPKKAVGTTYLSEGDRLEIIQPVAGG